MARKRSMNRQLNNLIDFNMRFMQMKSIAQNVFIIKNLDKTGISSRYVNTSLLSPGAVAFYEEPDVGLMALPFNKIGKINIYGDPTSIQCFASNGQRSRILYPDEYVIMYDNDLRMSIYPAIKAYAQRMSETARTADINIKQQRTPRIVKGSNESIMTVRKMFEEIEYNEDVIFAYKDFDLDDVQMTLAPSPYVTDKLDQHQERIWSEFCRFVGISDLTIEKKERLLKDEISASQGGAIASRIDRYRPRLEAVQKINDKFSNLLPEPLEVIYYDQFFDDSEEREEVADYEE